MAQPTFLPELFSQITINVAKACAEIHCLHQFTGSITMPLRTLTKYVAHSAKRMVALLSHSNSCIAVESCQQQQLEPQHRLFLCTLNVLLLNRQQGWQCGAAHWQWAMYVGTWMKGCGASSPLPTRPSVIPRWSWTDCQGFASVCWVCPCQCVGVECICRRCQLLNRGRTAPFQRPRSGRWLWICWEKRVMMWLLTGKSCVHLQSCFWPLSQGFKIQ